MTKIFIFDSATRNFLPTDIGVSLAFWFSAKDTSSVILSGSNVQEWRDKSGYNRHISAPASTNQPLWVPAGVDGLPLLRFDGVDDTLRLLNTGTSGLNHVTVLGVFRFVGAVAQDVAILLGNDGNTGNARGLYRASNSTTIGFFNRPGGVSSNFSADIGGGFHLFEGWNTALSGTNNIFVGRDGVVNSYSVGLVATGPQFSIGAWNGLVDASNIEVREILAFSTNLSTANLQKAEGYLMHEWGMANLLPADHPFRNRRPLVTD